MLIYLQKIIIIIIMYNKKISFEECNTKWEIHNLAHTK